MTYSILINTCDKFEDCWNPFFKLWSIYWKDYTGKIYLNTEYKDYSYPELDITTVKGCEKHNIPKDKRATWSECLKWALESIDTDIILYMQEDYFLKDIVKNELVEQYVQLMYEHPNISCIHLTDQAVKANGKSQFKNLNTVASKQRYRVSCQAALWRKQELLDTLREYESAWEFEEFGSQRSGIMQHDYYVVDKNWIRLNQFEIIPYIFTGIIQGRWKEEIVPLFGEHHLDIDFSKRGFYESAPPQKLKARIKYRLNKIPKIIKNKIELIDLKRRCHE